MSSFIPIILTDETLGGRHRQLNSLVNEAYKLGVPFQNIEYLPEKTPVDRLFKIQLASKLKNVDYILRNIKDEDLLYVSKALKCKWLLDTEHEDIINPTFLENELFLYMVTPAVGKFKNWLHINLRDCKRCEEFYIFYVQKDFAFGIKFLSSCSNIFVINESVKILHKLSPQQLKIICEKFPEIAEIYFQNIVTNVTVKDAFLAKSHDYYTSIKVILKRAPDIFLDINEKYFNNRFSKLLTKYIISHHKHRFNKKPELYTTRFLHIEALAQCLTVIECKEIVLKLARAKYLTSWFSYKNVEPLIKRLPVAERGEFKKRVFVDSDIGEKVEEWPYELPSLPTKENFDFHVFDDMEPSPYMYECLGKIKRKKIAKRMLRSEKCSSDIWQMQKTYLDLLFNEYRFMSFGKTLFELRRRIKAESSSQNREYIMLVLVSKSGGRPENLELLLELLAQHSNEPVHVRAAIVRSLVKRAAVWRLPEKSWDALLEFSRGLGLDGRDSECQCREGLHAVVLRNLLEAGNCEPNLRDAFIKQFSQFDEYQLNIHEKNILKNRLPEMMLNAAEAETNPEQKALVLELLFDTLKAYKVPVETSPLIPALKTLANQNFSAAQDLLKSIFLNKIARRTFFHENFSFIQTDASYVNALRHNKSVLNITILLNLIEEDRFYPMLFLRKISTYFSEDDGLMQSYLEEMKNRASTSLNVSLAKSLCLLLGANLTYICGFDCKEKETARFRAALIANMHKGRPKLVLNEANLSMIGTKAVANKVLVCPDKQVDDYIKILLKWKRTVRLGVVLSQRLGKEADAFTVAAAVRPTACLKAAIKYFRDKGDAFDIRVWAIVKPILHNFDTKINKRDHLCDFINKIDFIPSSIRAEYCTLLYNCFINSCYNRGLSILCHLELQLLNVSEDFIENILSKFLNEMNSDKYENEDVECTLIYVRVLVKYCIIAKNEEIMKTRFAMFGEKLLNNLELLKSENHSRFTSIFDQIMLTLQNNKIFFENSSPSPLLVMQNIVPWMHKHFPIESHFGKYVHIHLVMLYFKAIRQSIESMPHIFSDIKQKNDEGIDVVGKIFGKYIASEAKALISQYFNSIIEIYREHFCEYFNKYFHFDSTKSRFIVAIIKGILDNSKSTESRICLYLLKQEEYNIENSICFELLNEIKQNPDLPLESKFFVFAEFCS